MAENKRFVVAIHALTALALSDRDVVPSDDLAWSANMNASAVRRVLSQLRDADLVRSKPGPDGGFTLSRDPDDVTLLDVYRAVDLGLAFRPDGNDPNPECPIGNNMTPALRDVFQPIETALAGALEDVTLGDVVRDVAERIERGEHVSLGPDASP